jgi:hypothetical protein
MSILDATDRCAGDLFPERIARKEFHATYKELEHQ